MSVTVTSFIVSIMVAYGLNYLSTHQVIQSIKANKALLYIILGFFSLGVIVFLLSQGFSYSFARDNFNPQVTELIKTARKEFLTQDLIRFFILLTIGSGAIFAYLFRKISFNIMILSLTILILFDLIDVQNRYKNKYSDVNKIERQYFAKSPTDNFLLADKETFRIIPIGSSFGDNRWAYYHQTIGGYSAIKMYTIEEMIQNNLYRGKSKNFPVNFNVLKILNVKYIIFPQEVVHEKLELVSTDKKRNYFTYLYKDRLPRGFFVGETTLITDEYDRLKEINKPEFNPSITAILEEPLSADINRPDSSFSNVTQFTPNEIDFDIYTSTQSLFVISEMYYPPGWKILLDGQPVEKIYKTNHAIISFVITAGEHKVQMKFDPDSFRENINISFASASILYLMVIFSLIMMFKDKLLAVFIKKDENNAGAE